MEGLAPRIPTPRRGGGRLGGPPRRPRQPAPGAAHAARHGTAPEGGDGPQRYAKGAEEGTRGTGWLGPLGVTLILFGKKVKGIFFVGRLRSPY